MVIPQLMRNKWTSWRFTGCHNLGIHTFVHAWPVTFDLGCWKVPTHMMNICAKFHWNPSTKYRDIMSCEMGVKLTDRQTTDRWPDRPPESTLPLTAYCWLPRHKKLMYTRSATNIAVSATILSGKGYHSVEN